MVKGRVTDSAGRTLPGADVYGDLQLLEDRALESATGADGHYRIELDTPFSSWRMSAQYATTYNGIDYRFFHPLDDRDVVGEDGGVRDFEWRLSGPTDQPGGTYGAMVMVYVEYSDPPLDARYVELTLTPDGPLVDGSTGRTITAVGDLVADVPVGRYSYSARYVDPAGPARNLEIRLRDRGDYAASVTADFEQVLTTSQELELLVRLTDGG